MKLFSILALATTCIICCGTAWANLVPVVGSCTHLEKGWSQCKLASSPTDPNPSVSRKVQDCALSCYDYVDYQNKENCQFPPNIAQCVLTNPHFAGRCTEHVEYFGTSTAEEACGAVRDYLNDVITDACLKSYCSNTPLRRNWTLISSQ